VPDIRPVVLSGGSGTRLWPLSTPHVPKQFSAHIGERSLFGLTLERLEALDDVSGALVVTGARHLGLVRDEVSSSRVDVESILVEPEGRNTGPAAVAAALVARPEDTLVILPSDHLISDLGGFQRGVAIAASLARAGGIVTFGITPTRPETGYGYIEMGEQVGAGFHVRRFKEKPGDPEAVEMAGDGRHLWNSGMFVARADHLLKEARTHSPEIVEAVAAALPEERGTEIELGPSFASAEAISIDYAIMEKTDRALVVPLDVGWDDVGSYQSLHAVSDRDEHGNHIDGDVTVSDVRDSYIKSTSRPVVVAGLDRVVVVETPDGVLVVPLDQAQKVRDLQERATSD
jgi:mannose-1-phosphate guanylyltransferase/mannose-6-phosphate isomerase